MVDENESHTSNKNTWKRFCSNLEIITEFLGNQLYAFFSTCGSFFQALGAVKVPIIVVVLAAVIFTLPDQAKDIYRLFAEDYQNQVWQIVFSVFSIFIFSISLLYASRRLTHNAAPNRIDDVNRWRWFLNIAIRVLALGPIAALTIGSFLAVRPRPEGIDLWHHSHYWLVAALVVFFILNFFLLRLVWPGLAKFDNLKKNRFSYGLAARLTTYGMVALAIAFIASNPVWGPTNLGPISIICLFCVALLFLLSIFVNVEDHTGFPIIIILLVAAFIFSYRNNNHQFRTFETVETDKTKQAQKQKEKILTAKEAFSKWLENRNNKKDYSGEPYPVYIVTAEGGGLYAGYHAAITLARIQDNCPQFAQHLFAISGVSGGSLGAAVFAGLAAQKAENKDELACDGNLLSSKVPGFYETKTDAFFKQDFLSPLLAAVLFPDFFQRFWPRPIPVFDRARYFEQSLEEGWENLSVEDLKKHDQLISDSKIGIEASEEKTNFFESGVRSSFNPEKSTPVLIFNATKTNSGQPILIAPIKINPKDKDHSGTFWGSQFDLPMSTAVSLSARFPWVAPAGLYNKNNKILQLMDGGIYENSGTETANDLIDLLKEAKPPDGMEVEFKLLIIKAEGRYTDVEIHGETLVPIKTFLRAREERGRHTIKAITKSICKDCQTDRLCRTDTVQEKVLPVLANDLPLGWILSSNNLKKIKDTVLNNSQCKIFGKNVQNCRFKIRDCPNGDVECQKEQREDQEMDKHFYKIPKNQNACFYEFISQSLEKETENPIEGNVPE